LKLRVDQESAASYFVIDTGSPHGILWWRLLGVEHYDDLSLDGDQAIPKYPIERLDPYGFWGLRWRGKVLHGHLLNVPIGFLSNDGRIISLSAPFFVPEDDYSSDYPPFWG
jgi:hypothetical protein